MNKSKVAISKRHIMSYVHGNNPAAACVSAAGFDIGVLPTVAVELSTRRHRLQ
jgi:hypothetical protein